MPGEPRREQAVAAVTDQRFRIDDGPLQGWYHSGNWGPRTPSRTVTADPPVQPDTTLRISLAMQVEPGDPQWEVIRLLDEQQRNTVHAREIRKVALGLLLPRAHALLAVRDGWQIARGSSMTPAISGRYADLAGPMTTVRVSAADRTYTGVGPGRLGNRISRDGLEASFEWVRQQLLRHPRLPAAEDSGEWARRTEQFLQTPLPGQAHTGQYVLWFINAISSRGRERKVADSLEQAQELAAIYRPFNNTRVDAYQVVGIDNGMAIKERVDLGSAPRLRPHRSAAAFPRPAATALATGPHQPPGPAAAPATGRSMGPKGTLR
ncbi:hypothetical protein [Actinoplanes regularis]|uniref:hypothetical protein n=1 Tax=Actinoplanes regularis TaxID=52697 RepID=UPI0024A54F47|nr:hypothetical protein [Actinoplanes regularis]GLW34462.1 hypothetical protein Areg01_73990 [Actinoplanes regularis]